MTAYLWTGAPPPKDAIILNLCREYHCLPSELLKEDSVMMYRQMTCMAAENRIKSIPQ